jgi:hypothetical protein
MDFTKVQKYEHEIYIIQQWTFNYKDDLVGTKLLNTTKRFWKFDKCNFYYFVQINPCEQQLVNNTKKKIGRLGPFTIGVSKKEKGLWDCFKAIFCKWHLHGPNLNEENWKVQEKIIHVVVVIFHIHT